MTTDTKPVTCSVCSGAFSRPIKARYETCSESCRKRKVAAKAAKRRETHRRTDHDEGALWHGTMAGYSNYCCRCASCRNAYNVYSREWRKRPEVAERIKLRARVLAKRPDQVLKRKARQYGLDPDHLDAHLSVGVCFACGAKDPEGGLSVDHDHSCCRSPRKACGDCVRGLLCRSCNQALGLLQDDPKRLLGLVDYLNRWESRRASQ